MKKYKIMFWISTLIIVFTQGIGELVTYLNGSAQMGIVGLGYPMYFVLVLVVAKILGSIALATPQISKKVKEWAYAGFTFDFVIAFVSIWVVSGFSMFLLGPTIAIIVLAISYYSYNKLNTVSVN
jgi:hypothetical protein